MPHTLHHPDPRTVEVRYTGVVGYAERTLAVEHTAREAHARQADRLLIDFTSCATIEEDKAHRADYIARTITLFTMKNARVALVGVPAEFAWPAELACEIRHIPARTFDTREDALEWLALDRVELDAPDVV
ncbi:hypothetical protein LF41_523 [Lysobacter dokdonensis DS-58]|uniref:STAS/SEC14 domain-containing protein n=1 Tax=Lysobacter dokdonensis DS-58 TaxID=1300345 RepID=A0A0A2WFH1_9GAMM|nr:hypothetical protein [Lysobacter dokdonensis]KGQ18498.1 hypothetical protein LF41_523 [Lysobacter dokdonensis DS-58]